MIKIRIKQVFSFLWEKIVTKTTFDFLFGMLFVYCIVTDSLRWSNFSYSLFFLTLVTIYKYCLHLLLNNPHDTAANNPLLLRKIIETIMTRVVKYIKNPRYIVALFYILKYFPTNWPYLISLVLLRGFWSMRVWINSNKDIIAKKYFRIDTVLWYPKYEKMRPMWKSVRHHFKPFLMIFWYTTYLKVNLLSLSWEDYFRVKLVAIMYSSVLLANNLHFVTWFKYTEYITFQAKLIIVFVFVYIYLLYLPYIMVNKGHPLSREFALSMAMTTREGFVVNKAYLLFMLFSWYYALYIDKTHRLYLTKYTGRTAPSNFADEPPIIISKLGMVRLIELKQNIERSFEKSFNIKATDREIIWKYDKNYVLPVLVNMGTVLYSPMQKNFLTVIIQYELLKELKGNMHIEQGLKEVIQEYEDFSFLLRVWTYYVKCYWGVVTIYVENTGIIYEKLPTKITSNKFYDKSIMIWSTIYSLDCLPFGEEGHEYVPLLTNDIFQALPNEDYSIDNFKQYLLRTGQDLKTPLSQLRMGFYARKPVIMSRAFRIDAKSLAHYNYIDNIFEQGDDGSNYALNRVYLHFDKLLATHKAKHCVYKPGDTRAFLSKLREE